MVQAPLNPLIVIVGATGTGKSDLAVEIARKFRGEIINGDAMQLYHGLPIITNKITKEETKNVPHHLLGCIGLDEESWTVGKFVTEASRIITEIRNRGNLPILVGGTHYYLQSLLFNDALANEPALDLDANSQKFPILEEETHIIHAKLQEVDPVMAERWHPNERRKIQRSLEIYLRTGKPASRLYSEQRLRRELSPSEADIEHPVNQASLRYDPLVFWVYADKAILYSRLDGRVEKMLKGGLLEEVEELNHVRQVREQRDGISFDQSRGIWVSIGYKEFLEYQHALSSKTSESTELAALKKSGIEKTQAATRQYANRQLKWIRIKLLNALNAASQGQNTFLVDGSDLSRWQEDVLDPAYSVTAKFLSGHSLPEPSSLSAAAAEMLTPKRSYDLAQRPDLWQKKFCETCNMVATTENDWMLHVKSRAHRRAVGAKKKIENTRHTPVKHKDNPMEELVDVLENYMGTFEQNQDETAED